MRNQNVDFVPGVTCRELPPCPLNDFAFGVIQDLTQEIIIPGKTCRELPSCPPFEERTSDDISGITCKPLPPCPIDEIDLRTGDMVSNTFLYCTHAIKGRS